MPDRPFKFLDFYTREDASIFAGRRKEIDILLSDILSTRLVVLYAKTGSGKSSLINAGVRPKLEELEYPAVLIRGVGPRHIEVEDIVLGMVQGAIVSEPEEDP